MPPETPDHERPKTEPETPKEAKKGPSTPARETSDGAVLCEQAVTAYTQAERMAATTRVPKSIEYKQSSIPKALAYVPYLEAVLEEVKDKDEWTRDGAEEQSKERTLLENGALSVRNNLEDLRRALESDKDTQSPAHEKLRKLYTQRSSRLAELVANVDEKFENEDILDADIAAKQAQETIRHMTTDEAIDWVSRMMASIDGNNWQSRTLKEAYGKLTMACTQALEKKLAEEKAMGKEDPTKRHTYRRHCMEVAQLFSDQSTPIDSDLTNLDFAEDQAREAMDFEELAIRYVERSQGKQLEARKALNTHVGRAKEFLPKLASVVAPEVIAEWRKGLNVSPTSIVSMAQQYSLARVIEEQTRAVEEGRQFVLPAYLEKNIATEFTARISIDIEGACVAFDTFLKGNILGFQSLDAINDAIGTPPMTGDQIEALSILRCVKGERIWSNVRMGAKIGAMIAAGVAVGVATGGLGLVAASIAGGAAMTAVNAGMNQQGFSSLGDAVDVYGKDLATNTATMGAARYLAAGRAIYQSGASKEGAKSILKMAAQKGGLKTINSLDDGAYIGTRLMGAALEGSADTLIGASLDTMMIGGTFVENLESNAMFAGLGSAEFVGPALRKIRRLPKEELHGLAQTVNRMSLAREKVQRLGAPVDDLLKTADPRDFLSAHGLKDAALDDALEQVEALKKLRGEFEADLRKLADEGGKIPAEQTPEAQNTETKPEAPDGAAPRKPRDIPKTVELPPTNPEQAMRIESAIDLLEKSPDAASVRTTCILEGENGKVGEKKQIELTITYIRRSELKPNQAVDIVIECPEENLSIKMSYSADDRSAYFTEASTGTAKGYGFYSKILTEILRPAQKVEAHITNDSVANVTLSRAAETTPNSVLGTSEIGAARTRAGFINGLDTSGTEMTSLRVEKPVADLLGKAIDLERAIEKNTLAAHLADSPDNHPARIAQQLQSYVDANKGTLDPEVVTMLEREIKHLNSQGMEASQVKQNIMKLPDTAEGLKQRMEAASAILRKTITPEQREVIIKIHKESPDGRIGFDENGDAKYPPEVLRQWIREFEAVGITPEESAKLLRMGVCGSIGDAFKKVISTAKNAISGKGKVEEHTDAIWEFVRKQGEFLDPASIQWDEAKKTFHYTSFNDMGKELTRTISIQELERLKIAPIVAPISQPPRPKTVPPPPPKKPTTAPSVAPQAPTTKPPPPPPINKPKTTVPQKSTSNVLKGPPPPHKVAPPLPEWKTVHTLHPTSEQYPVLPRNGKQVSFKSPSEIDSNLRIVLFPMRTDTSIGNDHVRNMRNCVLVQDANGFRANQNYVLRLLDQELNVASLPQERRRMLLEDRKRISALHYDAVRADIGDVMKKRTSVSGSLDISPSHLSRVPPATQDFLSLKKKCDAIAQSESSSLQVFQNIKPQPDAVQWQQGEKIWYLRQPMKNQSPKLKTGLYELKKAKNGSWFLCDEGGVTEKITPEIAQNFSPVRNLQQEAQGKLLKGAEGWKLHINIDRSNIDAVHKTYDVLEELNAAGLIDQYKIGGGGELGKEATVYIGNGLKVQAIAEYLQKNLGKTLLSPGSDTLENDRQILGPIWGRFDNRSDSTFSEYGKNGVSNFANIKQSTPESTAAADKVLRERYGDFYTAAFESQISFRSSPSSALPIKAAPHVPLIKGWKTTDRIEIKSFEYKGKKLPSTGQYEMRINADSSASIKHNGEWIPIAKENIIARPPKPPVPPKAF